MQRRDLQSKKKEPQRGCLNFDRKEYFCLRSPLNSLKGTARSKVPFRGFRGYDRKFKQPQRFYFCFISAVLCAAFAHSALKISFLPVPTAHGSPVRSIHRDRCCLPRAHGKNNACRQSHHHPQP